MPYAPYVLAPNARTVHLLRAHAVTSTPTQEQLDPQLHNCILTWFRVTKEKMQRGTVGTTGIKMVSLMRAVIVFVTTKNKGNFLKLLLLL